MIVFKNAKHLKLIKAKSDVSTGMLKFAILKSFLITFSIQAQTGLITPKAMAGSPL